MTTHTDTHKQPMTKLSSDQILAISNLYGQLIANLYSMDRGESAGTQQMFYDYSKQHLEKLSALENYIDFKEEAEMPIRVSLKYNPEIAHIALQLESPSTFPLNEFYTKSFKRFFINYKEWLYSIHIKDKENIDEDMLTEIIKELNEMKGIITTNIPEGLEALNCIEAEIINIKFIHNSITSDE